MPGLTTRPVGFARMWEEPVSAYGKLPIQVVGKHHTILGWVMPMATSQIEKDIVA